MKTSPASSTPAMPCIVLCIPRFLFHSDSPMTNTLQDTLNTAVAQVETDADLLHKIVHGNANTSVTIEGGEVKTPSKAIAGIETEIRSTFTTSLSRAEAADSATAVATIAATATIKATEASSFADRAVAAASVVETLPVGMILPYAGTNIPSGYLFCDGSAIAVTAHPRLSSLFVPSDFTLAKWFATRGYYVTDAVIIDAAAGTFGQGGFSNENALFIFSSTNRERSWTDGSRLSSDDGAWGASLSGYDGGRTAGTHFSGFHAVGGSPNTSTQCYLHHNGASTSGFVKCLALLVDSASPINAALQPTAIAGNVGSTPTAALTWVHAQETAGHCTIFALPQSSAIAEAIIGRPAPIDFGQYRYDLMTVSMASLAINAPIIRYIYYLDDVLKLAIQVIPKRTSATVNLPDLRGHILKGASNPSAILDTTNAGAGGSTPLTTINYIIKAG